MVTQITNFSLLNSTSFRFTIARAPYLSFFTQVASLPTISVPAIESPNPFTSIATPGDHINWEPLSVVFLIDEDLNGWLEIYNWMRGLGFPESFDEYRALAANPQYNSRWEATTSDISVFTATGAKNLNFEYKFKDAFPIELSAPTLAVNVDGVPTMTAKAMFAYTEFTVTKQNND